MAVTLGSTGITFPDATTQTTAASAGGARSFTTSGTVSAAGLPVALNSDGTVSTVSNVALATGSGTIAGYNVNNAYSTTQTIVFNSATNTYVASFLQVTGTTMYVVAGTLSGSTITWGTPLSAGNFSNSYLSVDEASGNYLLVYVESNVVYAKVLTVSGTTCTLQARVTVNSTLNSQQIIGTYDNVSGKHVIGVQDSGTAYAMFAFVGTVSGTTSTWVDQTYLFGTEATISGTNGYNTFGVTTDRLGTIVFWAVGNSVFVSSANVMVQVGTISGTALTLGTTAQMTYTSTVSAVVMAYNPPYACWVMMIIASTNVYSSLLTVNATTRSWTGVYGSSGSGVWTSAVPGYNSATSQGIALGYDATAGKLIFLFRYSSGQPLYAVPGQIVQNSITGTRALTFEGLSSWSNVFGGGSVTVSTTSIVYSATAGKIIYIVGRGSAGLGWVVQTTAYSTNTKFIGVSTASAASGASLSCTIIGGVNTGVTGLTTGSNYYASSTGTLTTTPTSAILVGRALSATSLLVTQGNLSS
jgi:hypothetical protein